MVVYGCEVSQFYSLDCLKGHVNLQRMRCHIVYKLKEVESGKDFRIGQIIQIVVSCCFLNNGAVLQNHLDLHAVLWLESYMVKWPKSLIVVSHAREFLNTVRVLGKKCLSYCNLV